jgi:hypothetical protein
MNFDPAAPSGGTTSFPDENQLFQPLYDSDAFADFEQAMDDMLEALVGRWVHLAAPSAGIGRLRGTFKPTPKTKKAK